MEDNEIQNSHFPNCSFNEGVACDPKKRNCSNCGWNPSVAQNRLKRICNKRGIEVPEKATEGS